MYKYDIILYNIISKMDEGQLYRQTRSRIFRQRYTIHFICILSILIVVIIPGLAIYCVPKNVQVVRNFEYNGKYIIRYYTLYGVVLGLPILIISIFLFIVDPEKNLIIMPVIEHYSPDTLIHIINNLKHLNGQFFRTSIDKNINLNQEFPEYKTFSTDDTVTRKK